MKTKLFLDDERPSPPGDWVVLRSYLSFAEVLTVSPDFYEIISLDHDLGSEAFSGYDAVCLIESLYQQHRLHPQVQIFIHSANPSGSYRMARVLEGLFNKQWSRFIIPYSTLCKVLREDCN